MKLLEVMTKEIRGCYTRVDHGLLSKLKLVDSDLEIKIDEVKLIKPVTSNDNKSATAESFIVKYTTDLGKPGEVKVEQRITVPASYLPLNGGIIKEHIGVDITLKEKCYELIFDTLLSDSTIIASHKLIGHAAKKFLVFNELNVDFPVTIYIDGDIYSVDVKGKATKSKANIDKVVLSETMKYLKASNIPLYVAVGRIKITDKILKEEFELKDSHIKVLDALQKENLYNHILLLPAGKY